MDRAQKEETTKMNKETFRGDKYINYLDHGDGFVFVCISKFIKLDY